MPTALPQPFEVTPGPVLQAMRLGQADRLAEEQRGVLKSAGGLAAQGDLTGARGALYQGGMLDEASKITEALRQADNDALMKSKRHLDVIGGIALASDTPEKWQASVDALQQAGVDVRKYRDFSSRDAALAQSGMMQQQINNEMKRRQLDIAEQKNQIVSDKNAQAATTKDAGLLSDDAVSQAADYYIRSGGKMPPLGQGTIGSTNRAKVMEAVTALTKQQGGTAADIVNNQVDLTARNAGARTGGTQEAKMTIASQEITNLAPIALEKMDALADTRGSFMPYNKLVEAIQKGTNDSRIREAALATTSLVTNYAAVMGRGSPQLTDSARQHAEELLQTTFDKDSYHAVVKLMMREADLAKKAPSQVREQNRQEHGGSIETPKANRAQLPADQSLPQSKSSQTMTPAPVKVQSVDEAMKLPSGSLFITPDGRMNVRP